MELRPRTALVDIGNRVAEPRTRSGVKKAAAKAAGACGQQPGTRAVLARAPEKTTQEAAAKKALSPAPETRSRPDPTQLEPQSSAPVETSGCAPSDDVLYQAFSDVLLDIKDVNGKTNTDPNFCSSYASDIYKYLRGLEESQSVRPKYLDGQKITGNMRAMLIDWLVRVQIKFRLHQETLYMTVAIIDRFIQDNAVPKRTLQLVGVTAMFIASKYEEMLSPTVEDFAYITNYSYTSRQICQMEMKILQALGFCLGCPLPPHFLRRASMIAEVDFEQHVLAKYLMELSIVDYDMVHFPPSKIAAAASCLSLKLKGHEWTPTLQYHMFYTETDLLPVMQHIAKNVILVNEGITQHMEIKKKYSTSKNIEISSSEQLKSSLIQQLAQPLLQE
ncbi:G2/mitotic-specific cyclin-B1 [Caloenas nicobarica]|uniref:G2/mitotic-specific cyclin-B1 n=1 Tax=Caloenas nicobarica TaxID=187106 RepID=UPI0032B7B965